MKHIFKKITSAVLASAVFMLSATANLAVSNAADTTPATVTIHFDYEGDGITIEDDAVIEDITVNANRSEFIPSAVLLKDGYSFSGWTSDGVRGYEPGDVIALGTEDVTLKPVWLDESTSSIYPIYYLAAPFEGTPAKGDYALKSAGIPGSIHTVSLLGLDNMDNKKHSGWIYNDMVFKGQQKIVMPDHEVRFIANWLEFRKMTMLAGDVDRVVGATFMEFDWLETGPYTLGASNRFARNGFNLVGWLDKSTGETYPTLADYIMPSRDVELYAIWEPKNYVVVFNPKSGSSSDNIKISGLTDSAITVPECTVRKSGYTFGGWSYNGTVYQPGDEFVIPGAPAGSGISLTAVWNEAEDTTTTTTTTSSTTTESTTTSTDTTTGFPVTTYTPEIRIQLYVDKEPKSVYDIGEKFDISGAEFHANITYFDEWGLTEDVTATYSADEVALDLSEFDSSQAGRYAVRFTVTDTKYFSKSGRTVSESATAEIYVTVVEGGAAETVKGDSNCDGELNLADAVFIMQSIANPSKYILSEEGKTNGDVDDPGSGITSKDALRIQQFLIGIVKEL